MVSLRSWLARLPELGLVEHAGRTKATRHFVPPGLLRDAGLDTLTTLKLVQPHRLRALILEDLGRFPDSSISDVRRRIGSEIPARTVKHQLDVLATAGAIAWTGERLWRRYRVASPIAGSGDAER
jgi:ATP-dependent DNA helicase RecG